MEQCQDTISEVLTEILGKIQDHYQTIFPNDVILFSKGEKSFTNTTAAKNILDFEFYIRYGVYRHNRENGNRYIGELEGDTWPNKNILYFSYMQDRGKGTFNVNIDYDDDNKVIEYFLSESICSHKPIEKKDVIHGLEKTLTSWT